jgi:hypothetical protein
MAISINKNGYFVEVVAWSENSANSGQFKHISPII